MILAGRTNLLAPGLNFGVEIPIGRHVSIGADYWYPWWLAKNNKYCGEMLGWFIDGKYWFSRPGGKYEWTRADKLKGHALGLYAGGGYYDYQKRKNTLISVWTTPSVFLSVARNGCVWSSTSA